MYLLRALVSHHCCKPSGVIITTNKKQTYCSQRPDSPIQPWVLIFSESHIQCFVVVLFFLSSSVLQLFSTWILIRSSPRMLELLNTLGYSWSAKWGQQPSPAVRRKQWWGCVLGVMLSSMWCSGRIPFCTEGVNRNAITQHLPVFKINYVWSSRSGRTGRNLKTGRCCVIAFLLCLSFALGSY